MLEKHRLLLNLELCFFVVLHLGWDFPGLHLASTVWSHGDGLLNSWLMVD